MKVLVEATQEEFDQKRPLLLKALAKRPRSRYDQERSFREPRQPYFQAQAELWTTTTTASVKCSKRSKKKCQKFSPKAVQNERAFLCRNGSP